MFLQKIARRLLPPSAETLRTLVAGAVVDSESPLTEAGVCRRADLLRYPDMVFPLLDQWVEWGWLEKRHARHTTANYYRVTSHGKAHLESLAARRRA